MVVHCQKRNVGTSLSEMLEQSKMQHQTTHTYKQTPRTEHIGFSIFIFLSYKDQLSTTLLLTHPAIGWGGDSEEDKTHEWLKE